MMIDRVKVCKEDRTITRSNGHVTHIRDLSPQEVSDMVYVADKLFSRFKYNLPRHLQEELESFINEEIFISACKFDGRGELRRYLYFYGRSKIFYFHRSHKLHSSRFHHSPETAHEVDETEITMLWDMDLEGEDPSRHSIDEQMRCLTERERIITEDLMKGYAQTEIVKRHGISRVTIHRDLKKIKQKLNEFYGGNINENL